MKKIIFLLSIAFFFVACEPNKIADLKGRVRLVNACSSIGDVNLFVDYEKIYATDVQYLNYSLYRDYIAKKHTIQIKDVNGNVLIDSAITIEDRKSYSVYVYDSLATIKLKIIQDLFIAPIGSACKMRFLNLSKDNDFIDVYKTGDSSIQFLNYANGQNSEFVEFQSGYTKFDVTYAGTNIPMYSYYGFQYKPGAYYTTFLKGTKSSLGKDSIGIYTIENHQDY